ncbi:hypothetical protein [Parvularcula marina]|uniref:Uncharacterized protein n=1 Tax=Parvularcula marina TaxID=2292771 RepID=A0A371RGK9_9PROT|nr:hypothetical protein [Parvularcula marina]RFB04562.1 hypothetical protein DX908_04250 [Parvularcula marina]
MSFDAERMHILHRPVLSIGDAAELANLKTTALRNWLDKDIEPLASPETAHWNENYEEGIKEFSIQIVELSRSTGKWRRFSPFMVLTFDLTRRLIRNGFGRNSAYRNSLEIAYKLTGPLSDWVRERGADQGDLSDPMKMFEGFYWVSHWEVDGDDTDGIQYSSFPLRRETPISKGGLDGPWIDPLGVYQLLVTKMEGLAS